MKALGVTYHFLSKPLIEMAKCHLDPKKPSICHWTAGVSAYCTPLLFLVLGLFHVVSTCFLTHRFYEANRVEFWNRKIVQTVCESTARSWGILCCIWRAVLGRACVSCLSGLWI